MHILEPDFELVPYGIVDVRFHFTNDILHYHSVFRQQHVSACKQFFCNGCKKFIFIHQVHYVCSQFFIAVFQLQFQVLFFQQQVLFFECQVFLLQLQAFFDQFYVFHFYPPVTIY